MTILALLEYYLFRPKIKLLVNLLIFARKFKMKNGVTIAKLRSDHGGDFED